MTRIVYNKSLSVYLWKGSNMGPSKIDVQLNLEDLVHCDVGKAFIGMTSDGYNADFAVDVRSMILHGINTFNSDDQWNGLSVNYVCSFPVDLVLSPTILERYRNIFRLLFPLKCVQFHLNKAWSTINDLNRKAPDSYPLRKMAGLRSRMTFVIDALLSYFYLDVLEVRWAKLKESLATLKEFEDLRRQVSSYLESIYSHTFLNYPVIISQVFALVAVVKRFLNELQLEPTDESMDQLHEEFDNNTARFLNKIDDLNSKSSSQYLSQLLIRMNFNRYYEDRNNLKQLDTLIN